MNTKLILNNDISTAAADIYAVLFAEQDRTVTITQETEVMRESEIIDFPPVSVHERGNQKQQRTLRLMEIGHQNIHYPELESGYYYDSGTDFQFIQSFSIEI